MAANVRTFDVPLTFGQREDADKRVLPEGAVTRAKNLRLRKDGRWGVRHDYTAATMTDVGGANLVACDLHNFDDRLVALGRPSNAGNLNPRDLFEYVDSTQFAWRQSSYQDGSSNTRLGAVTCVVDMGRLGYVSQNTTRMDVAAGGGLVCMVYEDTTSTSRVHVFDPDTDATIHTEQLSITNPRVIAVGSVFFVLGISAATIELYRFDKSSDDDMVALTDAFGTGDTIVHYDAALNLAADGFIVAVQRDTPAAFIETFNSSGAASGSPITGPTVASLFLSVCETTNRIHLAQVVTSDQSVDLYSYSGGSLQDGPTELVDGAAANKQVGLSIGTGEEDLDVTVEESGTGDLLYHFDVQEDHTLSATATKQNLSLQAKPLAIDPLTGSVRVIRLAGVQFSEPDSFRTSALASLLHEQVHASKDRLEGGAVATNHLPTLARDVSTGKCYWPQLLVNEDGVAVPFVSQFEFGKVQRRQTASLNGQLYIAAGQMQMFDTRMLLEVGMPQAPVISSVVASNGAGSLPVSSTFNVAVAEEWFDSRGYKHQSPISNVEEVTTSAVQDTVDFNVATVHSARDNTTSPSGTAKNVIAYRSKAGTTVLRRAASKNNGDWGKSVSFTLTGDDDSIAENEVIYTQDGRSGIGSFLEHESPLPGKYVWRMGKRLIQSGLTNPYLVQVSKSSFRNEPVNWSNELAFFLTCPERVRGIAALDTIGYVFSRESIYAFTGDGPEDDGSGEFPGMVRLPSSTGLKNWESLLETPLGLFFAGDGDKIYLLPRGSGAPVWISQAVRDTLTAFPEVKAATLARQEQLAVFACENSAGTDCRIISYDLRARIWNVDEFASSTPAAALTHLSGRIARLQSGAVYLEDSTAVPSTFIAHGLTQGVIRPFQDNGWGRLYWFLYVLEFRGNCTVTGKISYDDGVTFTTVKAFELSTADYSAGDLVRCQFWPQRRKGDRFVFDIQVTDLAGAATEGMVIHSLTYGARGLFGGTRQAEKRG